MKKEFLAVPMIAFVVGYGLLIAWAAVSGTGLAWTLLIIASIALAVLLIVLVGRLLRRDTDAEPIDRPVAPEDGAYRVLVVVDDGSTSTAFRQALVEPAAGRPTKAFVVAPALASGLDRWTGDQSAYDQASLQLEATLGALRDQGVQAEGRVGPQDPVQAVVDGLREFPADAIVLATHPDGHASWVDDGVVESVMRRSQLPVTHVIVED